MNAHFVADQKRKEVTWIGTMGIVVEGTKYKQMNQTKIRFVAKEGAVFIGENVRLEAKGVGKILLAGGHLSISERESNKGPVEVFVSLQEVGLDFTVRFVKGNHLDMMWNKVIKQPQNSHGLIGQFQNIRT